MQTFVNKNHRQSEPLQRKEMESGTFTKNEIIEALPELERGVYAALETYSNVHRGSGHNSMLTTHLYEQARGVILEYLGLSKSKYTVIFCTPRREAALRTQLKEGSYQVVSSLDIGLLIGIRALAVKKEALPRGIPSHTGGGTAKLISKEWVIWADGPDKFEAGTPSIMNTIAFAKALRLLKQYGKDIFEALPAENLSASEILYNDELKDYSGRELLDKLQQTLIGRGVHVPTVEGLQPFVNLDNSASTPTFTPIWDVYRKIWHQSMQVQQEVIREVRNICSGVLGAPLSAYDVIFTSNTTEAINLVAESLGRVSEAGSEPVVLNTLLEHSSNDLPWRMVPEYSLIRLNVSDEGFIDLNELETVLQSYNQKNQYGLKRIKLVAVCGASNVLGVCNDLEEISRITHQYGARILVDAAQLVAHRKVEMERCEIDYLAFSAHKVYAPFGTGALMVRKGLLHFNTEEMEKIQSSGEENAAGIAALGKALVLLSRIGMDIIQTEEQALTTQVLNEMKQIGGLKIYGIQDPESVEFTRKIGVVVFTLKNMMPNQLARELALRSGIGVRYGCHCAHIIVKKILHVGPSIERFQWTIQTLFPKLRLPGVARVSLGIENNKEDVDRLIHALGKISDKSREFTDRNADFAYKEKSLLRKTVVQKQMSDFVKTATQRIYSQG